MTTKAQDTTVQQRRPGDVQVPGGDDSGADKRQAGAIRADAGNPRPALGDLQVISRAVVKKLFGKRHWAAPWALDLCNADPQFLTHLAEQPRGYVHFLCLVRLALLERGGDGGDARESALVLRAGNKRALLDELFPSCPADIIDLLPKLPKKPFHEEGYRALMGALEDESMRSHLLRGKSVTESTICFFSSIENIPARFRPAAMHFFFVDYSVEPEFFSREYFLFLQVIRAIEVFNLKVTEQEFNAAAKKSGSAYQLQIWILEKVSKLPFPAPPWDGNDQIRPIRSPDEWEKAAAKFNFALRVPGFYGAWASRIVAGYCHLYVCDHIPAVIIIRRSAYAYEEWCVTGWAVIDIRGPKHKRIGLIQEYELRRVFHQFLDANIPASLIYSEEYRCGGDGFSH